MKEYLGQKVLITTSAWFFAPDGKQYRAVWGTLKGVHSAKENFGFNPNASHANWVVEIGNMLLMGCQAHYCILCQNRPDFETVEHTMYSLEHGLKTLSKPNEIYLAE